MRYLIVADFEYPEREFKKFEKWVKDKEFDKIILLGDMASKSKAREFYRKLKEVFPNKEIIYIRGNTERYSRFPDLKENLEIFGVYLEHGHRFDPTYTKIGEIVIKAREKSEIARIFFRYILSLRGFMKISYNNRDLLKEGERNKIAESLSKIGKKAAKIFERVYLRYLFKNLPRYSIIAHVHSLRKSAYRCGEKKLFFIPPFPDYAVLNGNVMEICTKKTKHKYKIES